ncbi:MAG: AAA family ATPase, partial [Atopobium minutum]|nr:AAA family ATPase [Atopobium minutum]
YMSFVSAKDGVGKTTALVNTAVALARCNKKVVVVDCDMLYGDVGCYFGIDSGNNDIGELLQEVGEPTIDDIRQHLVIHESGVNVFVRSSWT